MPSRTDFSEMTCSIARAWDVIGEPWTPLILRDLAIGVRRFELLRQDLGVSTNVLASRIRVLEDHGVVRREPYREGGRTREEYVLTQMGAELVPVLAAVMSWGDRWLSPGGAPAEVLHESCGGCGVSASVVCGDCGEPLLAEDMRFRRGPGGAAGPGTQIVGALDPS